LICWKDGIIRGYNNLLKTRKMNKTEFVKLLAEKMGTSAVSTDKNLKLQ
jgi:hypothetical protein